MMGDDYLHGLLPLYKPRGMLSKDVSRVLQRLLNKEQKLGHVGSLDPLAEGVLPMACGYGTRLQDYVLESTKVYEVRMVFGFQTDTMDMTGKVVSENRFPEKITFCAGELQQAMTSLQGRKKQVPPLYSAVRYRGRRLYDYARAGEAEKVPLSLLAREVCIHHIELQRLFRLEKKHLPSWDSLQELQMGGVKCCPRDRSVAQNLKEGLFCIDFSMRCGKGTYVRSLCDTLAKSLGVVGTMMSLKRTETAGLDHRRCVTLEDLIKFPQRIRAALVPLEQIPLDLPKIWVSEQVEHRLRLGQKVAFSMNKRSSHKSPELDIDAHDVGRYHQKRKKEYSCLVLTQKEKVVCIGLLSMKSEIEQGEDAEACNFSCILRQKRTLQC